MQQVKKTRDGIKKKKKNIFTYCIFECTTSVVVKNKRVYRISSPRMGLLAHEEKVRSTDKDENRPWVVTGFHWTAIAYHFFIDQESG